MGGEIALPGALDSGHSALMPRYLEGQAAVTIQHVACGDLFTACLTGKTSNTSSQQIFFVTATQDFPKLVNFSVSYYFHFHRFEMDLV